MTPRSGLWAAVLGALFGCAAGAPPGAPVAPGGGIKASPLRVMTFNIRFGTAPDGENAWGNRRDLALRVIRDSAPAILGLQEALRFQLDEIERALPAYAEIGVGRDDGVRTGEYAAILYDRYRFQVLGSGWFWLSATPEVPGSMTWGNRYPRIVTWGRFRDRTTGKTFTAYNTHWDHESQPARENGARLMMQRIVARPTPDDPVLLLGDLNCADDNPAFRILTAWAPEPPTPSSFDERPAGIVHLVDTFRWLYPSAVGTGTFHSFRGSRDGAKIDFVMVSPLPDSFGFPPGRGFASWQIHDAGIVHTHLGGRYSSDHFPVMATLELIDVPQTREYPLKAQ